MYETSNITGEITRLSQDVLVEGGLNLQEKVIVIVDGTWKSDWI